MLRKLLEFLQHPQPPGHCIHSQRHLERVEERKKTCEIVCVQKRLATSDNLGRRLNILQCQMSECFAFSHKPEDEEDNPRSPALAPHSHTGERRATTNDDGDGGGGGGDDERRRAQG